MSTIKSLRFDISSSWDGAGLARAREELDALKRDLDEINGRDVRAQVTVDVQGAQAARATLDDLARTRTSTVRVQDEGVAEMRAKLDDLARLRTARVNANLSGDTEVRARLDQLIRTRTAEIRANLQDMGVAQRLDLLSRDRHARIIVDADKSKLDALNESLDQVGKKFEWAKGMAANFAAGIMAIAPSLLALTTSLLGLGGAVVSAFGSAGLALAPFAASMMGTVKSGAALEKTLSPLNDKLDALKQHFSTLTPPSNQYNQAQQQIAGTHQKAATTANQYATQIAALKQQLLTTAPGSAAHKQITAQIAQAHADAASSAAKYGGQLNTLKGHLAGAQKGSADYVSTQKQIAATQAKINQAMAGATPVQIKVAQSISDLKDKWQAFQKEAEKTTGPVLAAGFNAASGAISHMLPIVRAVGPIFQDIADKANEFANSNGMTKFVDWIIKVGVPNLKNIMDTIGHLFTTISQIIAAFAPQGLSFTKWLSDVTKKLNEWGSAGGFQRFADKVTKDWPQVKQLLIAGGDALKNVLKALEGFTGPSLTGFTLLMQAIAGLSPGEIQAVATAFLALKVALVGIQAVQGVIAVVRGIGVALNFMRDALIGARIAALAFDMSLAPFLGIAALVVLALAAIGVGIYELVAHWKGFTHAMGTAWNDTWNAIKTAASATWNWLKNTWDGVAKGFSTVWSSVSGGLKTAWSATWNGLKTAGTTIWNALKTAWNTVAHAFATAWTAVSGALKSAWSATWNGLKTAGQAIWNGMKTAWSTVAHAFSTVWTTVSGALKTAWRATWDALKTAAKTVWDGIKSAWKTFTSDIMKTIVQWAKDAAKAVADFFKALAKLFVKGIEDLAKTLLKGGEQLGKDLLKGLENGIGGGAGGVLGKIASVGKSVLGHFGIHLGTKSPSIYTHQMGLDLNHGLSNGLSAGLVLSLTAAARVGIQVINALKNSFRSMDKVGIDAMRLLVTGFQAGLASLLVMVQSFGPRVIAAFRSTFQQLSSVVTQTMSQVNSAVRAGMTQMQSTLQQSENAMRTAWTNFTRTFKTAWDTAIAGLKSKWTADWNALKTSGQNVWNTIKTAWTTFVKTFATEWTNAFNALKAAWQTSWETLKSTGQTVWDAIKAAWTAFTTALNTIWTQASTNLQNAWKQAWTNMNTAAQQEWQTITQTIGTAVNKIIGIVNGLIKAWNAVAGAVDLPSISPVSPVSFAQGGVVGYAEGGSVGIGVNLAGGGVLGGYEPGRDTVPAMLSKGEGVLVPEAVRGLGEDFVHSANHHFSGGRAGRRGASFSGGRQHFASGGIATGAFGLPDPNAVKAMFDPLISQLDGIGGWSGGAGHKFGDVGKKMEDKLIQAIQAKIAAMMAAMAAAAGAGGKAGSVANLRGLVIAALKKAGYPVTAANIQNMLTRIAIESSGNPNAINNWDSNAAAGHPSEGLAQITTTNFATYGSGNILNPMDNLVASLNYISAVYGGNIPTGAAYARGTDNAAQGWALVGEEGPEMVNFGGGETVLNADQTRMAFSEGGGGGHGGCTINVSIDARGSTPESVDKLRTQAIPELRMALQAGVGKKGR